jgi:hypothetical protein
MANSPQGWQYPRPPGPVVPGSMARSMRPTAMRQAVSLMYAGAAVGAVVGIVSGLTTHNITFYSLTSSNTTTVHHASSLVSGIIEGSIEGGLWLWMAWKTGAGRNWARVLSSVFFGFMCLQFIGSILFLARSSSTAFAIIILVEWGVGLAAYIQLWRRESGEFFALAKQARLASQWR